MKAAGFQCWLVIVNSAALLVPLIVGPSRGAAALTTAQDTDPLSAKVKLCLGNTTLQSAVAAISQQAGVKIEVGEAVAERNVVVELGEITAQEALDALTDMCGIVWRKVATGKYIVKRRTVRPITQPSQIGDALRSTLPPDLRTYLGLANWDKTSPQDQFRLQMTLNGRSEASVTSASKLMNLLRQELQQSDAIPFNKLDGMQRKYLLANLLLRQLSRTADLLYDGDQPSPHQIDPATATLMIEQDSILMVKGPGLRNSAEVGFGKNIMPRP